MDKELVIRQQERVEICYCLIYEKYSSRRAMTLKPSQHNVSMLVATLARMAGFSLSEMNELVAPFNMDLVVEDQK